MHRSCAFIHDVCACIGRVLLFMVGVCVCVCIVHGLS